MSVRTLAPDQTVLKTRPVHRPVPPTMLIAHRGASGYRPEHTLAAYELAIEMGADYIEPDVVCTRDGVLVARHENEIGETTNVSAVARFADRRTTKWVDGRQVTGWFTEDFTLAELKTLRATERLPFGRPANTVFDGRYEIPTLAEVVELARRSWTRTGRRVGLIPETKHPSYFRSLGLPLEDRLLAALQGGGYSGADDPVWIQSFETDNLRWLARRTGIRLVQLIDGAGGPYDLAVRGGRRSYADLASRQGLRRISRYADAVGLAKDVMIPRDADNNLGAPTAAIGDAHRCGLTVVGWTFRRENMFLPTRFRSGSDPNGAGDLAGEIRAFREAGMDAFFTDNPDVGLSAMTATLRQR